MQNLRAGFGWGTSVVLATALLGVSIGVAEDEQPAVEPLSAFGGAARGAAVEELNEQPSRPVDFLSAAIYSNSGSLIDPFLITRPGGGCSGGDTTDLQTALGLQGPAFNCRTANGFAVADDFVVPSGQTWTIDQVVLYLYQTNVVNPSVTSVSLNLQATSPLGGFIPALTGYPITPTWTDVYKNLDTDQPGSDCTHRIQVCVLTLQMPYVASAGMHYIVWQASGTGSSGPWVPPVVIPGATGKPGANAMQASNGSGGVFVALTDPGPAHVSQDLVFVLRGTIGSIWLTADMNCDGTVNFADINPFVTAITSQATYELQYPDCRWLNADCNHDGTVNFGDINPFVGCLMLGGCP